MMVIEPKVRGFICTSAHPVGCAASVKQQIDYVKQQGEFTGPKNVLVIGASTGYGLASRIAASFGAGASTIGVFFERPAAGKRTASAGWYNSAAFEREAHAAGIYAKSINGDAFSDAIKDQTVELIKKDLGKIDLVIYSLASPRRQHPKTGEVFSSVLKPIDQTYQNQTVDPMTGNVKTVSLEPANESDICNTVAVMGGEDWAMWLEALSKADVLAEGVQTVAYSYIGPELTYPIYKDGTIGQAKKDLGNTSDAMNEWLEETYRGQAFISVNKALVTQASAAIPVVPLYISALYRVMKAQGTHEGCIEQMERLFREQLYASGGPSVDDRRRIRIDDREMLPETQAEVDALWSQVNSENIELLTDLEGYRSDFYQLFGFGLSDVDYAADVDPNVNIDSIES